MTTRTTIICGGQQPHKKTGRHRKATGVGNKIKKMKTIFTFFACIAFCITANSQDQDISSKIKKQEKIHDKALPNLGDGVSYLFTYTDNSTFQLWQSNTDQQWYGTNDNNELVGPLTKEQ